MKSKKPTPDSSVKPRKTRFEDRTHKVVNFHDGELCAFTFQDCIPVEETLEISNPRYHRQKRDIQQEDLFAFKTKLKRAIYKDLADTRFAEVPAKKVPLIVVEPLPNPDPERLKRISFYLLNRAAMRIQRAYRRFMFRKRNLSKFKAIMGEKLGVKVEVKSDPKLDTIRKLKFVKLPKQSMLSFPLIVSEKENVRKRPLKELLSDEQKKILGLGSKPFRKTSGSLQFENEREESICEEIFATNQNSDIAEDLITSVKQPVDDSIKEEPIGSIQYSKMIESNRGSAFKLRHQVSGFKRSNIEMLRNSRIVSPEVQLDFFNNRQNGFKENFEALEGKIDKLAKEIAILKEPSIKLDFASPRRSHIVSSSPSRTKDISELKDKLDLILRELKINTPKQDDQISLEKFQQDLLTFKKSVSQAKLNTIEEISSLDKIIGKERSSKIAEKSVMISDNISEISF